MPKYNDFDLDLQQTQIYTSTTYGASDSCKSAYCNINSTMCPSTGGGYSVGDLGTQANICNTI